MAATTLAMVSGTSMMATTLSSSATFGGSQLAQSVPLRIVNTNGGRIVAVKATYSQEEPRSITEQVMNSVLAAGLAISLTGSAMAASVWGSSKGHSGICTFLGSRMKNTKL